MGSVDRDHLRHNNSTRGTNREGGTGIGLLLSREMVMANKGDIRVESEPGKGSTFFITVPTGAEPFSNHKNLIPAAAAT